MKVSSQHSLINSRYVIRGKEAPIRVLLNQKKLHGLYLITEDRLGVARLLSEQIIYRGGFAYVIENKHCLSEGGVQLEVDFARSLFGPAHGLIHLAGLAVLPMPDNIEAWHEEVLLQCKSFFYMLQYCRTDLLSSKDFNFKRLISCSLLGGNYGRDLAAQPGLPLAGGIQGLLRSLEYEWDNILAKTLDFDLTLSAAAIAENIAKELYVGGGHLEIGYPGGVRTVFATSKEPLVPAMKPAGMMPEKKSVILATGGARGITAESIQLLSNEDNIFILAGRSDLLDKQEFLKYQQMDQAELRAAFIAEARQSKGAITPRMIESKISRILNDREMRENISILRRTGSKVRYVSCNVADPASFGSLIDSVYAEHGKIDVVVHGAGVIDDYLLADKTATSFDKVFDTKVNSAFILYNKLRWETLKCFVFFSSTAGRYGNKGQSDYAAANETLNRLAWRIRSAWPNVLVKALNWGPWTGVGMATGVVNDQFVNRGIYPLSAESGTRHFIGELMHGDPNEVEVVAGEGTWDPERENHLKEMFSSIY